jgi:hypothetical protein
VHLNTFGRRSMNGLVYIYLFRPKRVGIETLKEQPEMLTELFSCIRLCTAHIFLLPTDAIKCSLIS